MQQWDDVEALQLHSFNIPPFAEAKVRVAGSQYVDDDASSYSDFYLSIAPQSLDTW